MCGLPETVFRQPDFGCLVALKMKYHLFDVVLCNQEIPDYEFLYGKMGAIIEIYTVPNLAYEIEFCDDEGKTIGIITLSEVAMDNLLIVQKSL